MRVNLAAVTAAWDLVGLALVVAGLGLLVGTLLGLPYGLLAAGVGCLLTSWVLQGAPLPHRRKEAAS